MYLICANFLFFICGCALLSFGTMAIKLKITSALLIPINILKSKKEEKCKFINKTFFNHSLVMSILGIMLIFASLIGLLSSFHTERRSIHVLRTTTIAITFLYHVSIAVIVYIQAVHTTSWLSQTWAEATTEYRLYAQTKVITFLYPFFTFFFNHYEISSIAVVLRIPLTTLYWVPLVHRIRLAIQHLLVTVQ